MTRVLVTGAAGALGSLLREKLPAHLAAHAPAVPWVFRFSDFAEMAPMSDAEAAAHTQLVPCDLSNAADVTSLLVGVDAVVHLGGFSVEGPWSTLLSANVLGAINLYEAARAQGTQRVLFASSNHAIGLYRRSQSIDHTANARPDSRYGVTKAFGEDLAWLFAHKHGIKSLCLRIGSCVAAPTNARMLSTWLSYGDFLRLVTTGLVADYTYDIVYGVSANSQSWWDNRRALELGYVPEDNAQLFTDAVAGITSVSDVAETFHGGHFAANEFEGDLKAIA